MNYRIEKKEAFTVYGIEKIVSTKTNVDTAVPQFWTDCITNGEIDKLIKSSNNAGNVNAIHSYRNAGKNSFPYMLFVNKTENSITKGYTVVEIPAATWAIFKTVKHSQDDTTEKIQNLNKHVYTNLETNSLYEKIPGYEIEMYYNSDGNTSYCETWVRVVAK